MSGTCIDLRNVSSAARMASSLFEFVVFFNSVFSEKKTKCRVVMSSKICFNSFSFAHICELLISKGPNRKAVFVQISDEYAANILRTALFTVIVRYIFTSCRKYPANKSGMIKK